MLNIFYDLFEVPKLLEPHMPLIITEKESELIIAMNRNSWSMAELVEYSGLNSSEAREMIKGYYKRGILNKVYMEDGEVGYAPATLYLRLGIFAQYENEVWNTIAVEEREQIDKWYLNEYKDRLVESFETMQREERILPLKEAADYLTGILKPIYVLPCNCRRTAQNCCYPVNVCLQFEDGINTMIDRGWGNEISMDEAMAILVNSETAGLIHTVSPNEICNCDSCCCYPFRTALAIGSKGKWPRSEHIAQWDNGECINCGICVKRCQFHAFTFDKSKGCVTYNKNRCWGCGVCMSKCPKGAISMIRTNQKAGDC